MNYLAYLIIFFISQLVLVLVSLYCFKHRDKLTQMEGMMTGMVMGMFSGLITGALYLIPTGDFLYGFIAGSLVGICFGVLLGRLGGHLGVLEGVMAGPMGGMMGAMLGQMIRPFNIEVFMPFLMFIFLVTMSVVGYMVFDKINTLPEGVAPKFFVSWTIPALILLIGVSIEMPFSITANRAPGQLTSTRSARAGTGRNDQTKSAVLKNNVQEVELLVAEAAYSPSTIYAKENIPLVIKARALPAAGCVSEIVFKDLGIKKIVPLGGSATIKMGSLKKGVYAFSCPMGMAPGKLVVQGSSAEAKGDKI